MRPDERLALSALLLMAPAQVSALTLLIETPKGVPRDDPGLAALLPSLPALAPLLDKTSEHVKLADPQVRAAMQAALAPYHSARDPVAQVRSLLASGRTRAALSSLDENGGVFCSMVQGLDTAVQIAALFPDDLRRDEPTLVMLDAVNAMKSGQIARADLLVENLQGRARLPALERDQSRLDYRLVTFRFVKSIYEDRPIGAGGLRQLYRVLAQVPVTASVERGLLYHVALDFYLRKGDWAAARQAAQRAVFHFDKAGARALAFYVQLYIAITDLAQGEADSAGLALSQAAALKAQAPGLTDNDALLLASLELIQRYEAGEPEPWVQHLLTAETSIPFGEMWPAMAAPILTYGRRALGAYATTSAALAWVRRWRVQQTRSDRFGDMITIQEIRALQTARRWQEADELIARLGMSTQAGTSADQIDPGGELAQMASAVELNPRAPSLSERLARMADRPDAALRLNCEALIYQAQAALARADEDSAVRSLQRLVQLAPPDRLSALYTENRDLLSQVCAHRLMRPVLKRLPQLERDLAAVGARNEDVSPARAAGLTRQEARILALLAEGLPNKAIAQRLGLALPTVKFHLKNVYAKLGCSTRRDAVVVAMERGMLVQ